MLAHELDGHQVELALGALAQHARMNLGADQLADHEALDVVDRLDGNAVQLDDQILRPESCLSRRAAVLSAESTTVADAPSDGAGASPPEEEPARRLPDEL